MSVTLFEAHFNSIIGLPVDGVAYESLNQNLIRGSDNDYYERQFQKNENKKIESLFELTILDCPFSGRKEIKKYHHSEKFFLQP